MKTILSVFAAFVLVFGVGGAFAQDLEDCATTVVYVDVEPNCCVVPLDGQVDMGSITTGLFCGYIPFRVDANSQNCVFWAAASYLYKGCDPDEPTVSPIYLCQDAGILCEIPDGYPVDGQDNYLDFVGTTMIEGFCGMVTCPTEFESSQIGHLSQDVLLTVVWNQDDPEKPQGQYCGRVCFYCMCCEGEDGYDPIL